MELILLTFIALVVSWPVLQNLKGRLIIFLDKLEAKSHRDNSDRNLCSAVRGMLEFGHMGNPALSHSDEKLWKKFQAGMHYYSQAADREYEYRKLVLENEELKKQLTEKLEKKGKKNV